MAGDNFGCGSSREHAVWALMDYGVEVVISPRFGDIFRNNSLMNGLLPITVDERTVICVLTHDPKFDVPLLEVALRTPAGYIGAMGSRRRPAVSSVYTDCDGPEFMPRLPA